VFYELGKKHKAGIKEGGDGNIRKDPSRHGYKEPEPVQGWQGIFSKLLAALRYALHETWRDFLIFVSGKSQLDVSY